MALVGVQAEALHSTGTTVAARADGAQGSARSLQTGLGTAGDTAKHPVVSSAISRFVEAHITPDSHKLGDLLTSAGTNIANTASTARGTDENGAHSLNGPIQSASVLNRSINIPV